MSSERPDFLLRRLDDYLQPNSRSLAYSAYQRQSIAVGEETQHPEIANELLGHDRRSALLTREAEEVNMKVPKRPTLESSPVGDSIKTDVGGIIPLSRPVSTTRVKQQEPRRDVLESLSMGEPLDNIDPSKRHVNPSKRSLNQHRGRRLGKNGRIKAPPRGKLDEIVYDPNRDACQQEQYQSQAQKPRMSIKSTEDLQSKTDSSTAPSHIADPLATNAHRHSAWNHDSTHLYMEQLDSTDDWSDGQGPLLQPETRPISHEQLVHEVKDIYAGLVMVEAKCIEVEGQQNIAGHPTRRMQLTPEQWSALIALHKTLLHEHHDFFLASQHPSASPALKKLAEKYRMPAKLWKHGIHAFLETLRFRLPGSLGHMLEFICIAYSMMALLYETVPSFEDTWIECLGDLGRYRMAIGDEDIKDRDVWSGVARFWYSKAANRSPQVGRLHHHLAILARPYTIELCLYMMSLTAASPFESTQDSILSLFKPILNRQQISLSRSTSLIECQLQLRPPRRRSSSTSPIRRALGGLKHPGRTKKEEGLEWKLTRYEIDSSKSNVTCYLKPLFGTLPAALRQPQNEVPLNDIVSRPLPEDYYLRGQVFLENTYPPTCHLDEEAEEQVVLTSLRLFTPRSNEDSQPCKAVTHPIRDRFKHQTMQNLGSASNLNNPSAHKQVKVVGNVGGARLINRIMRRAYSLVQPDTCTLDTRNSALHLRKTSVRDKLQFLCHYLLWPSFASVAFADSISDGGTGLGGEVSNINIDRSSLVSDWGRLFGEHPLAPDGPLTLFFGLLLACVVEGLIAQKMIKKIQSLWWIVGATAYWSCAALVRKESAPTVVLTLLSLFFWAMSRLGYAEFKRLELSGRHAFPVGFIALLLDLCLTASLSSRAEDLVAFFPPALGCSLFCWTYIGPRLYRAMQQAIGLPLPVTASQRRR